MATVQQPRVPRTGVLARRASAALTPGLRVGNVRRGACVCVCNRPRARCVVRWRETTARAGLAERVTAVPQVRSHFTNAAKKLAVEDFIEVIMLALSTTQAPPLSLSLSLPSPSRALSVCLSLATCARARTRAEIQGRGVWALAAVLHTGLCLACATASSPV